MLAADEGSGAWPLLGRGEGRLRGCCLHLQDDEAAPTLDLIPIGGRGAPSEASSFTRSASRVCPCALRCSASGVWRSGVGDHSDEFHGAVWPAYQSTRPYPPGDVSTMGVLHSTDGRATWTSLGDACLRDLNGITPVDPTPLVIDGRIVVFFMDLSHLGQPVPQIVYRAVSTGG